MAKPKTGEKPALYDELRLALQRREITSLHQIFNHVPRLAIAQILGMNSVRFRDLRERRPELFRLSEINALATALRISPERIVTLINNEMALKERKDQGV